MLLRLLLSKEDRLLINKNKKLGFDGKEIPSTKNESKPVDTQKTIKLALLFIKILDILNLMGLMIILCTFNPWLKRHI